MGGNISEANEQYQEMREVELELLPALQQREEFRKQAEDEITEPSDGISEPSDGIFSETLKGGSLWEEIPPKRMSSTRRCVTVSLSYFPLYSSGGNLKNRLEWKLQKTPDGSVEIACSSDEILQLRAAGYYFSCRILFSCKILFQLQDMGFWPKQNRPEAKTPLSRVESGDGPGAKTAVAQISEPIF